MRKMLAGLLAGVLLLSGCTAQAAAKSDDTAAVAQQPAENAAVQGGFTKNQTLDGADGIIHFSYYLPDGYDSAKTYPLIVAMPGYGEIWFGEDSAGSNLRWNGVQAWTKLSEPVILVSGQLTDWGAKSARQANELAEYMIDHFSVDTSRVYAAGYSAGGETMSRAVAMRPDLYAAYIHGGSQWDGTYDPVAENRVAVYIFMAENDEYYGSQKARDAYANLHAAYEKAGLTDSEIDQLLQLNIPDNAYFNAKGIYNYHGGGSVVFDDENVLNWVLAQRKSTGKDDNNEKDEATSDGGHGGSAGDRSDSDGPGGRGIFSDVPNGAWYADAVDYVYEHGIMNGTSATTFSPNTPMTRAMLVTVLHRAAGSPSAATGTAFSDVPSGAYYTDAVAWASANSIVTGYGNGRFGSNDPVSRAQIAAILWRYAGSPSAETGQDFADESSIPAYASAAVDWARANGVVNGTTGNRFDPNGNATRAQVATILRNYLTMTPVTPQPDPSTGNKILVAYFSGSGNTERVAQDIAGELGADLFEITPVTPYTSADLDWTTSGSRVNREHDNEALRDIALTQTTPANWDEYDTVFIGYPIWWGIAAWPVNNFVKDNDFSGKTVIPFATSSSSGMGQSGTLLEEMANGGTWQSGQRFSSGASSSTVRDWAAGLGL